MVCCWDWDWFDYPILLHCSQTSLITVSFMVSLITLFFYTALKRNPEEYAQDVCLITLFFYTALKLTNARRNKLAGLITLFFYTALKHGAVFGSVQKSLITLFFYTALKQAMTASFEESVWLPYSFTLLSNAIVDAFAEAEFDYPILLHCSQTHQPQKSRM